MSINGSVFGQQPIDIAESTLKVGALTDEVFYYGFAEGDQLIFSFEEVKGKELKEIEIAELGGSSKFMDYKSKKVTGKALTISKTGVYVFRFSNSSLSGRICKFKIQRIPGSDATKSFNSSVYFRTVYDTTYIPVEEKYLAKSDTAAVTVLDQVTKVSSQSALNGNANKSVVDFQLPENTIAWSFYIGVGQEGRKAFEAGTSSFLGQATKVVSTISGYGPMAALALYGVNVFSKTGGSDNVKYWFITDWDNVQKFQADQPFMMYKQGDVVTEASQMKTPLVGKIHIALSNDNIMQAIEVNIKITAVQLNQTWATHLVNKMNVASRQVAYLMN